MLHRMDAATLALLKRGDRDAWEALVGEHQDRVLNYLYHVEGSYPDALDLAQETFFRAWRGIGTFREGEELLPWLFTIARNTQIESHRRRRLARFSIEQAAETGFEPVEDADGPQARAERDQDARRLREALLEIPEEYRTAVVLRFMQDLPYEEIARVQGVAVGTAKSRVFRGKELLARALEGKVVVE